MTLTPPTTPDLPSGVAHDVRLSPYERKKRAELASFFRGCCLTLFGKNFIPTAAAALTVTERTIHRWLKGEYPIPAGIFADLASQMRVHAETLASLADRASDISVDEFIKEQDRGS